MPSRAVFIDLDGTLVRRDCPYETLTTATLDVHLGTSSASLVETYTEAFFDAFHALQPAPYHEGFRAIVAATDADANVDDMVSTLHRRECQSLRIAPAARRAFDKIGKLWGLGILTNGVRDWQLGKLQHVGLVDSFDTLVTSYEAGAHKLAPAPFRLAEHRLHADTYVLLGDDKTDVDGARKANWQSVHYRDHEDASVFWRRAREALDA